MADLKVNSLFVHVAEGVSLEAVKTAAKANPSKIFLCADGTIINGKSGEPVEYGYNSEAKEDVDNLKTILKEYLPTDADGKVTENAVKNAIDAVKNYVDTGIADGNALQLSEDGTKFNTALHIKYVDATPATDDTAAVPASIKLLGKDENEISSILISDIIGNGILDSSEYDPTTGILTLYFKNGTDGTLDEVTVDLKEMLDLGDLFVDGDSAKYLTIKQSKDATEDKEQLLFTITTAKLADASETVTGLVDAKDAKDYIDAAVKISAEGDDYVSASISVVDDVKIISVAAAESTKTSLGKANTAIQTITGNDYITATPNNDADEPGYALAPKVSDNFSTLTDADKLLADAKTTKTYVDDNVAAVANALVATVSLTGDADKDTTDYKAGIKVVNGVSDDKITTFISAADIVAMVSADDYWEEFQG